jgi:hypothetical protein
MLRTATTAIVRMGLGCCLLAATVMAPAWGQVLASPATVPHPAQPGSINYVEGEASLGATTLDASCVGTFEMEPDQSVTTQAGKVEILLTPGVFLRLADNGSVKMISPDWANTELQLDKGRALVEVIDIRKQSGIAIDLNGAKTTLLKPGLYDFDAVRNEVRVFRGAAEVNFQGHSVKLEGNQKLALAGEHLRVAHFDPKPFEDEFYGWNGLRSGYLSEASVSAARGFVGKGAGLYTPNWVGAEPSQMGWYWNTWFGVYTFLPADGVYYGPFGWGFYSPIEVFRSPFISDGNYTHSFAEFHYPYGHGFPPPAARGGRIGR